MILSKLFPPSYSVLDIDYVTHTHTHTCTCICTTVHTDMTGTLAVEENTLGAVAASLKGMIERREEADAVEEWLEAIDPTLFIAELSFYSSEVREKGRRGEEREGEKRKGKARREEEREGEEREGKERRGDKLFLEIIS